MPARAGLGIIVALALSVCSALAADRNEWYWTSPVNIHWDNHSHALGEGMTVDEIAALFEGLDVDMIQVSARSTPYTTYPSEVGTTRPDLDGYDTMATWRAVTRKLGTKMWVYINVIADPTLTDQHPEWHRVDEQGNQLKLCNRPSADGSGYLETVMIPMVQEIIRKYDPDGFWFDGDWQIPKVCYCGNCKAAWEARTGKVEPPTDQDDPDWPAWVQLEQDRFDEYRRKLAAAIHEASDHCCYTSNWSWAISHRDARTAPDFADALSGDVGGGSSQGALYALRFASMFLSAQEHTPHDVMSAIYPKEVRSLDRMLQEGGLVMSSGSNWFLWVSRLLPEQFEHLRACTDLVNARRGGLGRTHSLNPVAVLLSETSWQAGLADSGRDIYDWEAAQNMAFALQDAHLGVDVVNERTLREQIGHYQVVVVPDQREVAAETLATLKTFVNDGGKLIVTGGALCPQGKDTDEISDFLGVTRCDKFANARLNLEVAGEKVPVRGCWRAAQGSAKVAAHFAGDGLPALTINSVGKGEVAYLALSEFLYPDEDGILVWLLDHLGITPMVSVGGPARDAHLVFSARERDPGELVLHVADLTTRVSDKRVEPNSTHEIDPVRTVPEVSLEIALERRPKSVRAWPSETPLDCDWEDGVLRLKLSDVKFHAAVAIQTDSPPRVALMPAGTPPARVRAYERAPILADEGFEDTPVGTFPDDPMWRFIADDKTGLRVTEVAAAGGKRSLEFVDDPNARASFVPYLYLQPHHLDRGRARFSCDIMLQPEAHVNIELRDSGSPYIIGPSIRFDASGNVLAYREELTTVPIGKWFRFEITFGLTNDAPTYDVEITVAGEPPKKFCDLPYRDAAFSCCGWLGIIGYSDAKANFYVDNVRLERIDNTK